LAGNGRHPVAEDNEPLPLRGSRGRKKFRDNVILESGSKHGVHLSGMRKECSVRHNCISGRTACAGKGAVTGKKRREPFERSRSFSLTCHQAGLPRRGASARPSGLWV